MRIAFVEPDGTGGLAHFAYELCTALACRGHAVQLITSRDYELRHLPHAFDVVPQMQLWQRAAREERIGRVARTLRRAGRGMRLTREWARVGRRLLVERPDLVLVSEILFPHLGAFLWLLRRRGLRLAQICHEFAYQEREGASSRLAPLQHLLQQGIYRQFDCIFFLAEATRSSFHDRFRFPLDRTARIPHGGQTMFPPPKRSAADFAAELGVRPGEPVVLFFGSIRPSKGLPDLLQAFALSRWRDRARLVVAGQPTRLVSMDEITRLAERLGLRDRLVLRVGYIPIEDVASYFEIARCVVLPYRSATQSGVAHLAYQCARPVVATAVGGLAEDVIAGETGLLVAPGAPAELAAALDRLFDDAALSGQMGARALELSATRFSWAEAARVIDSRLSRDETGGSAAGADCRAGLPPRGVGRLA